MHVSRYWLAPQKNYDGYGPTFRSLIPPSQGIEDSLKKAVPSHESDRKVDDRIVETFILRAKERGVRLVITISPALEQTDVRGQRFLAEILPTAKGYDVELLNFLVHPDFIIAISCSQIRITLMIREPDTIRS